LYVQPAKRELRQVARAHDETAHLIGYVHEDLRPLARLHVFKRDIQLGRIMPDVTVMQGAGRPDGDLPERHTEFRHQGQGVLIRAVRRPHTGHGDADDVRRRQSQRADGLAGDEQGQR
jgi:hypothetical protein